MESAGDTSSETPGVREVWINSVFWNSGLSRENPAIFLDSQAAAIPDCVRDWLVRWHKLPVVESEFSAIHKLWVKNHLIDELVAYLRMKID